MSTPILFETLSTSSTSSAHISPPKAQATQDATAFRQAFVNAAKASENLNAEPSKPPAHQAPAARSEDPPKTPLKASISTSPAQEPLSESQAAARDAHSSEASEAPESLQVQAQSDGAEPAQELERLQTDSPVSVQENTLASAPEQAQTPERPSDEATAPTEESPEGAHRAPAQSGFWDSLFRINEIDAPHGPTGSQAQQEQSAPVSQPELPQAAELQNNVFQEIESSGSEATAFEGKAAEELFSTAHPVQGEDSAPETEATKQLSTALGSEFSQWIDGAEEDEELNVPTLQFQAASEAESSTLFSWGRLDLKGPPITLFGGAEFSPSLSFKQPIQASTLSFHSWGKAQEVAPQTPMRWAPQNWLSLMESSVSPQFKAYIETALRPERPVELTTELSQGKSDWMSALRSEWTSSPTGISKTPLGDGEQAALHRQITRHLDRMRVVKQKQIQIQLKPSTLGKLRLTLQKEGAHYNLQILAESPHTRDILEHQMAQLKLHLESQGLSFQEMELGLFQEHANGQQARQQGRPPSKVSREAFSLESAVSPEQDSTTENPVADTQQVNTLV